VQPEMVPQLAQLQGAAAGEPLLLVRVAAGDDARVLLDRQFAGELDRHCRVPAQEVLLRPAVDATVEVERLHAVRRDAQDQPRRLRVVEDVAARRGRLQLRDVRLGEVQSSHGVSRKEPMPGAGATLGLRFSSISGKLSELRSMTWYAVRPMNQAFYR